MKKIIGIILTSTILMLIANCAKAQDLSITESHKRDMELKKAQQTPKEDPSNEEMMVTRKNLNQKPPKYSNLWETGKLIKDDWTKKINWIKSLLKSLPTPKEETGDTKKSTKCSFLLPKLRILGILTHLHYGYIMRIL